MLVSKIFTGAIMAVMSVTALAAATPQQIADGLKSITQKSQELQGPAQSITVVNAPLIVIGKGPFPEIIAGFTDIVSTATTLASQMGSSAERRRAVTDTADADSDLIFNAFHEFTRVMQALLNILIGKAGILQEIPIVGGPVAAVLRSVESIIDTIAITLINQFESRAADLTNDANSLADTLTITIQKYEGIAV